MPTTTYHYTIFFYFLPYTILCVGTEGSLFFTVTFPMQSNDIQTSQMVALKNDPTSPMNDCHLIVCLCECLVEAQWSKVSPNPPAYTEHAHLKPLSIGGQIPSPDVMVRWQPIKAHFRRKTSYCFLTLHTIQERQHCLWLICTIFRALDKVFTFRLIRACWANLYILCLLFEGLVFVFLV